MRNGYVNRVFRSDIVCILVAWWVFGGLQLFDTIWRMRGVRHG